MAKGLTIKNKNNEILYPKTVSELVYNDNQGTTVKQALATKQDTLVSGTNIKTVNNTSLLGDGDVTIEGKSAYQVAVDNGFSGSQQQWLESLKGPQGDAGNVTVTDGVAEITIVNNLEDGGSGDALSAEMGKQLNDRVGKVNRSYEIDLTPYIGQEAEPSGVTYINTSDKWVNAWTGVFIPVYIGTTIEITGNATAVTSYAFLKSSVTRANNSNVVTYATGAARVSMSVGETKLEVVPNDAGYLWVSKTVNSLDDRLPQSIKVVDEPNIHAYNFQDQIDDLYKLANGKVKVAEGTVLFKYDSTSAAAYSFATSWANFIFKSKNAGKYIVKLHFNDGIQVKATTSKGRILGIRARNDSTGVIFYGYDYCYSQKADESPNTVTYVFDPEQTDYELEFDLEANCILMIVDKLAGSASFEVWQCADTKINQNELGNSTLTLRQTFTSVSSFDMSQRVKVCDITASGRYRITLTMDLGWTSTASFTTSSKTNAFSYRVYSPAYENGGQLLQSKNYMLQDYTNSNNEHWEAFTSKFTWETDLEKDNVLYTISRIDGTGTITVELISSINDQLIDIQNKLPIDKTVSVDDIRTNELDGDIWLLDKKLGANEYPVFKICFCSDLHGDTLNARRVHAFSQHYNIPCLINGGDSVKAVFADGSALPSSIAPDFLTVIGNHDTSTVNTGLANNVSDADIYNTFIAPFADKVILPSGTDLCYWYKDYTTNGIRVIGINCMRWTTAQATWLTDTLESARTSNLAVVLVSHYPADGINGFDTGFNSRQWDPAFKGKTLYLLDTGVLGIVDNFIDAGGEFVCYLTGHQHRDHLGTCVHARNVQLQLTIDSSSMALCAAGIYHTETGINSIDFDILGIDRYEKSLRIVRVGRNLDRWSRQFKRICIDYENGCIYNRLNNI